jgi:Tol biopolymer transport system component
MILGTAGYMSPEQAAGQPVDKRADVWAFGVVLYEVLTGQRLFQGDSVAHILADVLRGPIDLDKLPKETPRRIRHLMKRCLDRDLHTRLRDIREARVVIGADGDEPEQTAAPPAGRSWIAWALSAAGFFAVTTAALSFVHFREKPPVVASISATILPPETTEFGIDIPALSPDGKWIVFGARTADNKNPLWIRPLASTTAQVLAGTDEAKFPFWSPDSRYVAFFAGGKLKKIDISGGPALAIADAPAGRGGSWSPDGIILFAPDNDSSLLKIAASGGNPSPALGPTKSLSYRFPWFLPDGRHFLFEETAGSPDVVLWTGSLDSPETVVLGHANSNAVYSMGHLLFLRENALMAQPFDEKSRTVQGEAVPVAEQVVLRGARVGTFTVSVSGLLAYQTEGSAGAQRLAWFDRGGKEVGTLGEQGNFQNLDLSPDRKSVALSLVDAAGNQDIWIYDTAHGLRTRFTFDPAADGQPVWSPDGNTIAWNRQKTKGQLYRKTADGKGTEELLYEGAGVEIPTSWSPDGKFLLFDRLMPGNGGGGIWSLPLTPEKPGSPLKPSPLVDSAFQEQYGVFSPDGHWVAYVSNESQRREVYVVPFRGPGGKRQISAAGGDTPRWRRDGKEIFYGGPDRKLMAAEVTVKAGSIEVGQVHPLGIPDAFRGAGRYDISLDGQRILAVAESERTASPPLTLVENWTALLKK